MMPGAEMYDDMETRALRSMLNLHLWNFLKPGQKSIKPSEHTLQTMIAEALPAKEAEQLLTALTDMSSSSVTSRAAAVETVALAASPDRALLVLVARHGVTDAVLRRLEERVEYAESIQFGEYDPQSTKPVDTETAQPRRLAFIAPLDEGVSARAPIEHAGISALADGRLLIHVILTEAAGAINALSDLISVVHTHPMWISLAYAEGGSYQEISGRITRADDIHIGDGGSIAFILDGGNVSIPQQLLASQIDQLYVYPDFEAQDQWAHDVEAPVQQETALARSQGIAGWLHFPHAATDIAEVGHSYRSAGPAEPDQVHEGLRTKVTFPELIALGLQPSVEMVLREVTDGLKLALKFQRNDGAQMKPVQVSLNGETQSLVAGLDILVFSLGKETLWPMRLQVSLG